MTRQLTFTDQDIADLDYERYHHPAPHIQKRMEIVYLKSQGLPHQDIARLCRVCRQTVLTTLRCYQAHGLDGLKAYHKNRPSSALHAHQTSLEAHFRAHPPRTIAEAQATIERMTGIRRSPTQIRVFVRRMGLRVRKIGAIPGHASDPGKQQEPETFLTTQLQPRLDEVRKGKRPLFLSMRPTSSMAHF